jgi:hypothetical protein
MLVVGGLILHAMVHIARSGVMRRVRDIGGLGVLGGGITEHGSHLILVVVVVRVS